MQTVTEHYTNHLAPIYAWMVGDFDAACEQADSFLRSINLPSGDAAIAVDLGCGHGLYSIPLARRGYRVVAVDTSTHLLGQLAARMSEPEPESGGESESAGMAIETYPTDLTEFAEHLGGEKAATILCMGDTLTHLSTVDSVRQLVQDCADQLAEGGVLAFSFRDYATQPLSAEQRFIPVRADENRIHTCFLEYHADTVAVHDIIHTRAESTWQMAVSAYAKLRLDPAEFVALVQSHGLTLTHNSVERGMHYYAFQRVKP